MRRATMTSASSPTSGPRSSRSRIPTLAAPEAGASSWILRSASLSTRPLSADEVIDVYKLAGIETPDLSILSDEFLDGLHEGQARTFRWNSCDGSSTTRSEPCSAPTSSRHGEFSEQLDEAINRYTNRALTTAEIIAELVELAKEMRDPNHRHEALGLSVSEAAFYDAICPERRGRPRAWVTTT